MSDQKNLNYIDDTIQFELREWVGINHLKLTELEIESLSYKGMTCDFILRTIEEKWGVHRNYITKTGIISARYRALKKLRKTRSGRALALLTGFVADPTSRKSPLNEVIARQ